MAYIYDLTDTWNAGGTTFNGIKLNVTDSASAVSSKLVALQTNGTEHFSVTKAGVGYFSGNVGIGTSSPTAQLHLAGPAEIKMTNTTNTSGYDIGLLGGSSDANAYVYQRANAALIFGTNNNDRMRILADGNVLVGRTTAYGQPYRMVVNGDSGASAIPMAINDDRSGTADSRILAFLRGGTETGYITSTNNTLAIAGSTTLTFQTVSSEQMRITNTGNVGIGTSSPGTKLMAYGTNGTAISLNNAATGTTSTSGFQLQTGSGGDAYIWNYSNSLIAIATNNTERMRIDSSGNLLVGTTVTDPTNGFVANPNSGNGFYTQTGHPNGTSSGVAYARFMYAQTEIGSITQNGTTGVLYNVSSDARLKKNITNADEASGLIDALQVRKFDWKSDNSHQAYGFIAQELLTVAPEAVSQPADPDDMMGVDYSKLVPMLVKEIQSLRARVAQLEGTA